MVLPQFMVACLTEFPSNSTLCFIYTISSSIMRMRSLKMAKTANMAETSGTSCYPLICVPCWLHQLIQLAYTTNTYYKIILHLFAKTQCLHKYNAWNS